MSIRGDPSISEIEPFHRSVHSHSPLGDSEPQGAVVFSAPSDLPGAQATTFAFGLNIRGAKALGLPIPHSVLKWADEVIR
jgi:hypothetical protein